MRYAALFLLGTLALPVQAAEQATLKLTQTIPLPGVKGRFDHFAIDVKDRRLFVAALGNNTLGKSAKVQLPKHPESFQLEQEGNRIFVNVPDAKQVAVIDRGKRSVVETWPMEKFQANFPMALDEANRRLFIGCRKPARLVVLDTTTGKPMGDMAISGVIDDLFYDANLKRLYLSRGESFIDVIDQRSADTYQLRERIPSRAGARTAFFSKELNEFYLAVPQRGNQQTELRVFQTQN